MSDDIRLSGFGRMVDDAVNAMDPGAQSSLLRGAALTVIDHREAMICYEQAPRMWGSPEAQEFQFLLMVDTCQRLLRPTALAANPYETRDAYTRFVSALNGATTSTHLHVILREEGRLDELPRLLGDFGRWVAREYPAEVPS